MIILYRTLKTHQKAVPILPFFRWIHTGSRFQTTGHEPELSAPPPTATQRASASLELAGTHQAFEEDELKKLESSVISKLNHMSIDRSDEHNRDLKLLTKVYKPMPALSPIDEHILKCAAAMVGSTDGAGHDSLKKQFSKVPNKNIKNNQLYQYKYRLISSRHSLEEVKIFTKFINRLTNKVYLNSNERIRSFLINRVVHSPDLDYLLSSSRELSYLLINYFLRNIRFSNIAITNKIIRHMGQWDVYSLNIFLKNTLEFHSSFYDKMNIVNTVLYTFLQNDISLNRTSVYLIYKHTNSIDLAGTYTGSSTKLHFKYFLQSLMKKHDLLDNKYITSIAFTNMCVTYKVLNAGQRNNNISRILNQDIEKTAGIIPTFYPISSLDINLKSISTKTFRKLFLYTKYRDIECFKALLLAHLTTLNWSFAWTTLSSTFRALSNENVKLPPSSESKTLLSRKYKNLKYSNFGRVFNFNKDMFLSYIHNSIGAKLLRHLSSTCNWQLFLRSFNELKSLDSKESKTSVSSLHWNIYEYSLRHLLETNLSKSHLNPLSYLVLVKYLLHDSLNTELGPMKLSSDKLFQEFQLKIDSIYSTKFYGKNHEVWKIKRRSARADRLKHSKFQLFDSLFDVEQISCNINGYSELFKKDNKANVNKKSKQTLFTTSNNNELIPSLITPDLSIITEFESILFKRLSKLQVLDTQEKVLKEYNEYAQFWDSKGINIRDVIANWHLGFINKSYKYNMIKWENDSSLMSENLDKSGTFKNDSSSFQTLSSNAINKIKHTSTNPDVSISFETVITKYNIPKKNSSESNWVKIGPVCSLHTILPNDWLDIIIYASLNDWLSDKFLKT